MSERISALMDGELADDDATNELAQLRSSGESRHAWNTYHLIGDALRGEVSPSYATRVSVQLATEPTVLAPRLMRVPTHSSVRYMLSAAAGVAGVALVVWTAAPVLNPAPVEMAAAEARAVPAQANAVDKMKVENYLFAHQPSSAMQVASPNIQLVTDERRERTR
jgi:sigma-E factor negative regulatory protein RseA